jgi:hypothetical protein
MYNYRKWIRQTDGCNVLIFFANLAEYAQRSASDEMPVLRQAVADFKQICKSKQYAPTPANVRSMGRLTTLFCV